MGKNRSVRYHNRVARRYDAIYDDAYWLAHDEITWRQVKPHLPRDLASRCLDLGCGTGKWGLKLLKSGYATTFVDHAPAMIGQVRARLEELGARGAKATTLVADIVAMPELPDDSFALVLAMGDPLSICSDPLRAAAEMFRVAAPGGVVIATADNRIAAAEHYLESSDLDGLERLLRTGKTRWLTDSATEQFELTTFTPDGLRKLFERSGFEVLDVVGKTVLPLRANRHLLEQPEVRRRLVALELELAREPHTAAAASHLQVTARKR
jgi:ubiquinone/menaquinone biosynthesis C-methylase UbiE